MSTKESNPKDLVGSKKAPMSCVSAAVVAEVGVAMLEGACKYGKYNYRAVGVRASVYYDATMRHLMGWWEGEDTDPDSGMSHITKAITSLVVLRDAMIQGKVTDDRPPSSEAFYAGLNAKAEAIIEKYKGCNPTHYTVAPKARTIGEALRAGFDENNRRTAEELLDGVLRTGAPPHDHSTAETEGFKTEGLKIGTDVTDPASWQRVVAPTKPEWTEEKPTTPGWYVLRFKNYLTHPVLINVFEENGGLVSSSSGVRCGHLEDPSSPCIWLGPFATAEEAWSAL